MLRDDSLSIDYYDINAEKYYNDTINIDLSNLYSIFCELVEKNGCILDAGCGSGRDSLYFKERGFQIVAMDASQELTKLASKLLDQEVLCMKFDDLDYYEEFDGIWACASLVHVSKVDIIPILDKMVKALKVGGVLYASFKYGNKEEIINTRLFNYYDEITLAKLFSNYSNVIIEKIWNTEDKKVEKDKNGWINIIVKRIS